MKKYYNIRKDKFEFCVIRETLIAHFYPMGGGMNTIYIWTAVIASACSFAVTFISIFIFLGRKLEQLENLKESNKELQKEHKLLNDTVIELKTSFKLCVEVKNPYAEQHSPMRLTDEGIRVRDLIKAPDLLKKYEEKLYACVDKTKMNNAYDIQVEAFKVVSEKLYSFFDEKETIFIKNIAYRLGKNIDAFLIIFQVLFRDALLAKYNMLVDDIDKHKPNVG